MVTAQIANLVLQPTLLNHTQNPSNDEGEDQTSVVEPVPIGLAHPNFCRKLDQVRSVTNGLILPIKWCSYFPTMLIFGAETP